MKKRMAGLCLAGLLAAAVSVGCGKAVRTGGVQNDADIRNTEEIRNSGEASSENEDETEALPESADGTGNISDAGNRAAGGSDAGAGNPERAGNAMERVGTGTAGVAAEGRASSDGTAEGKDTEKGQPSETAGSVPGHSGSLTDRVFTIDGADLHIPCTREDLEALGLVVVEDCFGLYEIYGQEGSNVEAQCMHKDMDADPDAEYVCVSFKMAYGKLGEQPDRRVIVDGCELGVMTLAEFDAKYSAPDRAVQMRSTDTANETMDDIREFNLSESGQAYLGFTFDESGLLSDITINLLYE